MLCNFVSKAEVGLNISPCPSPNCADTPRKQRASHLSSAAFVNHHDCGYFDNISTMFGIGMLFPHIPLLWSSYELYIWR
jgi:hypothetical protein